ncbi:MAG: peptide-methionine (R)-S-oxide reductase MsrB [Polyangiaceae bacterium]|nr:peptide-methionine (R)-S-oxide reductase MsrB [Polyangiaceae bacterium]
MKHVSAALLFVSLAAVGCRSTSSDGFASTKPTAAPTAITVGDRVYPKPSAEQLARTLSKLQFQVSQEGGTEPPFQNAYWDNHEAGLYVDVASGEPLFASTDKFDSGTGWPSFSKPVQSTHVVSKTDETHGMTRTEVRSRDGNSHLGHVFDDGPAPTGLRYCINSASLRFVPAARLEAEGYGAFKPLFAGPGASLPPPSATHNACNFPKPGEGPGCATSLITVVLSGDAGVEARLRDVPGVLETTAGKVGTAVAQPAVRVVFDPVKLSYSTLLERWSKATPESRVVYGPSAEQKALTRAMSERTATRVALLDPAPAFAR